MFVVQRRADGLYWRNTSGRRWRGDQWVEDLQDVKPFRTIGSIHSSFHNVPGAWYNYTRRMREDLPQCCKDVKWSYRGHTNKCEHFKQVEKDTRAKFYELYAVYEVEIVRVRECTQQ